MQVTKTGAELNFNFDKVWSARVSPAVVWTSNKLSKNNGNLELTVGLVYHFKNHDGNRVFTKARLYDEGEIRLLNNVIDNLRKDNLYLRNILKNKPKTIEIHKTDTVFIYPHLQFKQNSHYLESEAALYQMAEYMKNHPEHGAVIGSRALHPDGYEGYTLARRLVSHAYRLVLRLFFGLRLSDSQSGLKGFRKPAAEAIFSRCETDRFAFDFEAIMIGQRLGFTFAEMPARVVYNRTGGSISLLRDSARMLRDLFRIRRRVKRMK
jgi:hypothetical protein